MKRKCSAHFYLAVGDACSLYFIIVMVRLILHNASLRINLKKLLLVSVTISFFLHLKCDKESPIKPSGTGTVYGIVIDAQTGFPVTEAVVLASKNQVSDTTDSLGVFTLLELSTGQETLIITCEGYEDNSEVVEVNSDSVWIEIAINRIAENLYLYVGTFGGSDLFVVDMDSMQKEDSLYFTPGSMSRLYITPGGSKLYITQEWPDYSVYYLDTRSGTYHPTNLPNSTIFFNANNEGFLYNAGGLFAFDTLTDQTTQISNINLGVGGFIACDRFSPVIYFIKNEKLYSYDYHHTMVTDSLFLPPIWNRMMTPDNKELYFTTPNGLLGVINVQSGETEYITYANPNGQIAVTPDGQYVLVTDPGSNFPMSPGSGLVILVRTSDHSLDQYIDIKTIAGDNPTTSRIVITTSSNYAFAANSYGGDVFIIDLRQRKAIKRLEFRPASATIGSLVLAAKPKK